MNIERINQLKSFLEANPTDPFVLHALGLEYKSSELSMAEKYFKEVITHHPEYVGTYYHLAEVLTDLEKLEEAKSTYENGINMATSENEHHALRELKNAFQNFMFEYDMF